MALVELVNVSKRYALGDGSALHAVRRASLEVEAGMRVALVGPSGSGKSTLLHLIGAIDVPDDGEISVAGTAITALGRRELADYRARVGFVFQQFHLLPALSLLDNVAAPLVGRDNSRERHSRARVMLEAVGLSDRASARPDQLSGGQQQRVAIARALVVEPVLMLADEPTGNLDSATAAEILHLLAEVQEQFGTTLIIATHDENIAASCDRVVGIRDGRVGAATSDRGAA